MRTLRGGRDANMRIFRNMKSSSKGRVIGLSIDGRSCFKPYGGTHDEASEVKLSELIMCLIGKKMKGG